MPVVVQGFTRARKHQIARQAVMGTVVAATKAYPLKGVPSNNLNWTDPDLDTGSIVPTVAPSRGAEDLTFPVTSPAIDYDTLTPFLCAVFGGHEAPTGGPAYVWTHEPSPVAPLEPNDLFSYEWGDDVTTDWFQYRDGIVESFEITGPEGLGACSMSATWRFGNIASTGSTDSPVVGTVPTPALDVDPNPIFLYLKDMGIYIADSVAGLAAGQILNALHTFTMTVTQEDDQKRYANGDQSFAIDAYGRTGYNIVYSLTFAKTSDTVGTGSESDAWMSDDAVNRYLQLKFTSVPFVTGSTPYSWKITSPIRYYTRTEADSGGNTVIVLEGHAFYDPDDANNFVESVLVNAMSEALLGSTPS
jgi:hypothetical protein